MRKSRIALAVASFVGAAALALGTVAGSSHVRGAGAGATGQHAASLASAEKSAPQLVPVQLGTSAEATETPDPTESATPEPTDTPDPTDTPEATGTPEPDADVESNVQEEDSGSPAASTSTSAPQ